MFAMSRKTGPTSVTFTPRGRQLQIKYANAFGLKGLINAGLYLFDDLSAEDQIALVSRVAADEKRDRQGKKSPQTANDEAAVRTSSAMPSSEAQAAEQIVADAAAYEASHTGTRAARGGAEKRSQKGQHRKIG